MEWLKSRLRGTVIHRIVRRARGQPPFSMQSAVYDKATLDVMTRVLRRDASCIDVGAHKGDILQHMVELAPGGRHHAFEALPHLAKLLRDRFPAVHVHEKAVSDRSGQAEFQFVENAPAYSGLRRRTYARADPKVTTLQVAMTTLDEVIPADQAIALIKIDIEGGEYHALKGAVKTIRRCRPVIVFEAGSKSTGHYGVTPDDIYTLFAVDLDYELSTLRSWLDGQPSYTQQAYRHNWENGPEYFFVAAPKLVTATRGT